jgi:hypothetical protein
MTEQLPCLIVHLADPLSKSSEKRVPSGVEVPPVPFAVPAVPAVFESPPEPLAVPPVALVCPPVLVVAPSFLESEPPQATRDRLAKHVAKAKVVLVIDHLLSRTGRLVVQQPTNTNAQRTARAPHLNAEPPTGDHAKA